MGVTHVLRGEDHLTNTPRQIALLQALNMPAPIYGHISLIVDAQGAPLSKRSGSLSVQELREMGYFPIAVNNYLARLGHHFVETGLMDLDALSQAFDQSHLGRAPARYDRIQLDYWQAQAVQQADEASLLDRLAPDTQGLGSGSVPVEVCTSCAREYRISTRCPALGGSGVRRCAASR